MRNIAGFTNRGRAGDFRRGVVLGKTAMFFNVFPSSPEIECDFPVSDSQVRAGFLEEFQFFLGIGVRCRSGGFR